MPQLHQTPNKSRPQQNQLPTHIPNLIYPNSRRRFIKANTFRTRRTFEITRTAIADQEELDEVIVISSSPCRWSSHWRIDPNTLPHATPTPVHKTGRKKNATSKSDTTMKNKREKEGKRSSMEDDGDLERESGNVYRMGGEETRLIDGMGGGSFTFAVLA